MRNQKAKALLNSVLSLVLCISMLLGTTFAWFTDEVTSTGNIIKSGTLDVEMLWNNDNGTEWTDASKGAIFNYQYWEPGYTDVKYLKVQNKGDLAFQYQLRILPDQVDADALLLSQVIDVYAGIVADGEGKDYAFTAPTRGSMGSLQKMGTLYEMLTNPNGADDGILQPKEGSTNVELAPNAEAYKGEVTVCLVLKMQEEAGNEYQNKTIGGGEGFKVQLLATQYTYEKDSFGTDYDTEAQLPTLGTSGVATGTANVNVDADGKTTEATTITTGNADVKATLPAGVKMANGATSASYTLAPKTTSDSNITTGDGEQMAALDVHVGGVAADNTTPIIVELGKVLPEGMNMGNVALYHVEGDDTNAMTQVNTLDELDEHNEFYYDPATGYVTVAMATFSEVAVKYSAAVWNGAIADGFNGGSGTEEDPYIIANADQLAYFGAAVGGMVGDDKDDFAGKYIKLVNDIDLNDKNDASGNLFYPIGYYNDAKSYTKPNDGTQTAANVSSFSGTFDGNGHTIKNFYQNTWQMWGNYDGNYYKAAMGLFGYVYGGTVKNLTVDNFSSDGEFTPTGVIAAYAVDATFENIALTNCNPRVYNTGNGGIVGIGGSESEDADPENVGLRFTNITIDNTNIISALWGSWDVACGGLVGMFRGPNSVWMTNCHVAAQIDVYNDVCGNYQYYWYRYAGMMVGTNKNMITDKDGYTVPDTSNYYAKDCTVHFGDWNDYYYCELVANSLASYTHDHQFSRLTQIQNVSEIQDANGNWNTTGNFILMNGKTPTDTCYHIMKNAEGQLYEHKHDVADATNPTVTETVNGETVLKENNQRIYLPFNQLFTGYGWGVKHIPVYNGEDYAFEGITILDRQVANSVPKFQGKVTELANSKEYKLSDIFSFVDNGVELKPAALTVAVTNLDESNPVSAEIVYNRENWENGTITFSGAGTITLTIQDYYFCTPTTITVDIIGREPEAKFVKLFDKNFLYRVGNKNDVALGTLFAEINADAVKDSAVSVTFENVAGSASGTYTANQTKWENGVIRFSGAGLVKVIITDNDYCISTELYLEVINATNLTSATGTTTGGDFVLLKDVNTSTYVNYWNCTLYGNGFTYSLNGAPTTYKQSQGHGILITNNAILDNLVIVGDVYPAYGAYTNQDYYNAAVDVVGDTTIQNCYIANCAAPVKARSNVTIKDSTLYGGTVANLIITSGTATLENVTTANYDDGRELVGMGIVVHKDAPKTTTLVLNGKLTQYNFISEGKALTDEYAKKLFSAMFSDSCKQYHFGTSPNRYANTGIVSMTTNFNRNNIEDNANTGYAIASVRVDGNDGYVYSQLNTSGSVNNNYNKDADPHFAKTQGTVPPEYEFDYINKNYIAKQDGSNDHCYEDGGKVHISMDEGDTFNWDTSILTATKAGETLRYTVSMNGTDYTGKSIAFNTAGEYTVTYTYTDDYNFVLGDGGNITTYSKTYTKTVGISVVVEKAALNHAEFTFGSSNTATKKVTVDNTTYISAVGVPANGTQWGYMPVGGNDIYYPIVSAKLSSTKGSSSTAYFPIFANVVSITDYKDGGAGDSFTVTTTERLAAVKGVYQETSKNTTWYTTALSLTQEGPTKIFKWASSSDAPSTTTTYNGALSYQSPPVSKDRNPYITVVQYSYTDATNTTYYYYVGYTLEKFTYQSCVTGDTLVTLADGSQKRIDEVTYSDELLVWDFNTGKYNYAPSSILENHGFAQNTVVKLTFTDDTVVKVVNVHGFFDADLNKWVDINAENAHNYIGHSFTQVNGDGYKTVKLVDVEISEEYIEAWSILSADHYNCMLENMFSITPPATEQLAFFEIGENMMYDAAAKQADIEKYGLFTYEEFAHLLTYEQFEAMNFPEIKIAIGKGMITYEEVLWLIAAYVTPQN